MYHTKQVLSYSSWPASDSLQSNRGLYCTSRSNACAGQNMVWMTKRAAFFARSTQFGSSIVNGDNVIYESIHGCFCGLYVQCQFVSVCEWFLYCNVDLFLKQVSVWGLECCSITQLVPQQVIVQVNLRFAYYCVLIWCGCVYRWQVEAQQGQIFHNGDACWRNP